MGSSSCSQVAISGREKGKGRNDKIKDGNMQSKGGEINGEGKEARERERRERERRLYHQVPLILQQILKI